jgi:quinoprotein glucose dehydrogenase
VTFRTVPHPGEFGYDLAEGCIAAVGGANSWAEFSLDEKRGIALFPTGSPTYDMTAPTASARTSSATA